MKLKDLTKSELIFVVERMKLHLLSTGDYFLSMALSDVEWAREEKKCAESKQLTARSFEMRKMFADLMAPYEGKPLIDIPESVLRKAETYIKAAEEADRKWFKLNGMQKSKGEVHRKEGKRR